MTVLLIAAFAVPAFATPPDVDELTDITSEYIAIATSGTGSVWVESGVTQIFTEGEVQFSMEVTETYAASVDNCWVYFDGEVYSGTSVNLTSSAFRTHYGAVAIEYSDDTFGYASFEVHPYYDSVLDVTLNASAPTAANWMILPTDVNSVFTDVNGIEPAGFSTVAIQKRCSVRGNDGLCESKATNLPSECITDAECKNQI